MAILFTSWWSEFYFTIFALFFVYYLYFKFFASQFWKSKNISHVEPVFILGSIWRASITDNFAFIFEDLYRKYKKEKLIGYWNFTTPALMVTDIELIKNILVRDFNHFRDRGFAVDFNHDPLGANLFNLGGSKWRNLRVKLTPTFTSGKMKMMFPTMVECGMELQDYLKNVADKNEAVEIKEILARFTTDIISSCAFGIETKSLQNPNSEFRTYGKKVFNQGLGTLVKGIVIGISPKLFKFFKLSFTPKDVTDFFLNTVKETMEYREKNQVKRKDFMELLIQLKNKGKLEDVDGVIPTIPDEVEKEANQNEDLKFTFTEAAAQAFSFFGAGFETSSNASAFALYELAKNPDIQNFLQKEIDEVLKKLEGKLTYDGIMSMEYLDCVVQETLRKHPPITTLFRQCNKDYNIPELNVTIPKNISVMISILGIHKDPEFFPDPEKFDPNRHLTEERNHRNQFTYLPFGEGPRNCIGSRFGLLQTKVGLVSILSKYNVCFSKETPNTLKWDKLSFVLSPEGGIPLRFVSRNM